MSETIQVSGIRCEKCVMRLAKTLEGAEGLEFANANLMGQVLLSYDDERTTRDALVEQMARGGFREQAFVWRSSPGLVEPSPDGSWSSGRRGASRRIGVDDVHFNQSVVHLHGVRVDGVSVDLR